MDAPPDTERKGPGLGLALLALSGLALWLSRGIKEVTLGAGADPGPKLFPVGLSILLGVLAVVELARSRCQMPSFKFQISSFKLPKAASPPRQGIMVLAVAAYLGLLYGVGFGLATFLFSLLVMRFLGTGWRLASVSALVLVLAVHLLFVRLFKVPLPEGMLGLPL